MTGVQCDTCRVFSPQPDGWLFLLQNRPQSSLSMLFPGTAIPEAAAVVCALLAYCIYVATGGH